MNSILLSCFGLLLRSGVSLWPHSGQGKPPMFGDYEAQRHWQEVTLNHPIASWYAPGIKGNDLNYWGLDYPPLTAYHSYLNGLFARDVMNKSHYVELDKSHGLETPDHIIFMRTTVLLADILILIPALAFAFSGNIMGFTMSIIYPGLILIDNGHFQYNNVSLGLFIAAVGCLRRSRDLLGSFFFVAALSYKQMELYHALPFFFYLLGSSLRKESFPFGSLRKLILLGLTVLGTFGLIWFPFINPHNEFKSLRNVFFRIFPLTRGVFEDKVSNFWCSLNIFIKVKAIYNPEELMRMAALTTGLVILPSNLHLLLRPTFRNFLASLSVSSLGFFLFSFQVHEKSILLAVFPALLWTYSSRRASSNAHLIATWFAIISVLSMLPLLTRDGLTLPSVALSLIYFVFYRGFEKPFVQILDYTWNDFLLRFAFYSSLLIAASLTFVIAFVPPPPKYPDLWPVIISFYSSLHLGALLLYLYMYQFFGSYEEDTLELKKKNRHMGEGGGYSYSSLRERLDEMGYFQGFLPECLPLVEALFKDLLTTTHNLKVHKDKLSDIVPRPSEESFGSYSGGSHEGCSSIDGAARTVPAILEYERREEDFKKQIRELDGLNAHALHMISSLQEESLNKSKKISKLEASKQARISERSSVYHQPKMEITSYIKDNKGRISSSSSGGRQRKGAKESLDIVQMYESKNKMLTDLIQAAEEENVGLKEQLAQAAGKKAPPISSAELNPKGSSYISKILKDNAALKERIQCLERGSKGPFSDSSCRRLHAEHNKENSGKKSMGGDKVTKHMEDQHVHIHELEDQLRLAQEEIKDLKLRISHLLSSKKYFKDKVDLLQDQQSVLINSKDASKVKDLVSYMEKQRNIYRDNVHELLEQLGPDHYVGSSSTCKKVTIEEVQQECLECRRRRKAPSQTSKAEECSNSEDPLREEYRVTISSLKREKMDLISRLEQQRREIKEMESLIQSTKSKMEEWRSRAVSIDNDESGQKERDYLSRELTSTRDRLHRLETHLTTKESHLKALSEEKDEVLRLLDDKTLLLERYKEEKSSLLSDLNRLDSVKSSSDDRLASVMSQINALQLELKSHEREKDEFRGRFERERAVGVELRREMNELRMKLEGASREKEDALGREEEIKAHVQKYVNEVKRIEELLSICERERSELLEQYKHLSSDVSIAEVHNRKLESKVSSLELHLREKEIELNAAEIRMENLEKDLAEMSLSNENFRLQLASFTVRADLAESELKEARNQQSWINTDLSSVHELAVTLNSQKVELINKIAEQEGEIQSMSREIEKLKSELSFLRKEHFEERMKSSKKQKSLQSSSSSVHSSSSSSS